jgi:Ca2+-transporting ATPase
MADAGDSPDPRGLGGLTNAEAARQLAEVGPNELPAPGGRSVLAIVFETMREPMFLLMFGAAVLYLALGDVGEGLFLVAAAATSIGLVIAQEARSERALAALRELAQPMVRVIREGVAKTLPARELVPEDIILVGEGDRLPADGLLVAGDVLSLDESALTGESAPVVKRLAEAGQGFDSEAQPHWEVTPHVFSGTLVVRGQGVVRVGRTGARTALGRIGSSLAAIASEPTPLQKSAGRLVTLLGGVALGFCAMIAVAYGLLRHDWVDGLLYGVTVAIALVPEEFPMVLAVFMALGAWRLAKAKVLVRRSAVIEALGSATVLCVDKTGTLTENRMRVALLWREGKETDLETPSAADVMSASAQRLLEVGALASAVRPVDPMDRAIRERAPVATELAPVDPEPERTWPLRAGLLAVTQLWRMSDDGRLAAAKGAPEAIIKLCRLDAVEADRLMAAVARFAEAGLRVLAVAGSAMADGSPDTPEFAAFQFEGLIGFRDPVRPEVPRALAEARGAGVRVVMITGDHPSTALAIAREAGLDVSGGVLQGAALADLPFPSLREQLREVNVFARVAPEQKLLIVEALKADGEVVAMTGDGVNDAPALEAAHIGVAMGQKGTDVAREAADLVLLDDSFPSIVAGVRSGRRIFDNLRRALIYVTAIHVPIAGVALAPILFGLPPILYPMHVVLLELAIDPICALAFEGEPSEAAAMTRPPRRADEALFGGRQLTAALLQGASILAAVLGLYLWALRTGAEAEARGAAFLALVVGNLALALSDSVAPGGRLFARHRVAYWAIAGVAVLALAAALEAPWLEAIFRMAQPPPPVLLAAVAVAVASGAWMRVLRIGGSPAAGQRSARRPPPEWHRANQKL